MTVATADGLRLRIDRIADGLVRPTDIAFLPDGRVFVAEEAGQVRVLMPDGQTPRRARTVAAPRPDPTRHGSLRSPSTRASHGHTSCMRSPRRRLATARLFTLTRFREASNALVDPVVLRDDIPASTDPGGVTARQRRRDGARRRSMTEAIRGIPGDLASPNGKILRLNPDGTTPDDQAGFNPMYASDVHSPRGFDWAPGSTLLWIADRGLGELGDPECRRSGEWRDEDRA